MSLTQPAIAEAVLSAPSPVISIRPVVVAAPDRGADLQIRVTAPSTESDLPVIVFSHGFEESMDGYAPLANFWAAHGFAVLQPTHLDSPTLGIAPDDPRTPVIWRFRIEDLTRVLDQLDVIAASVPGLDGRLDRDRIAVAGHSWGATTASALIGARIIGENGRVGDDMTDPRIKAGVLLAAAGTGGDELTTFAAEHFAFMNPDFAQMTTAALVIAGDHDQSQLSTRGPDWWTDIYSLSPDEKSLLTLFGSEHTMGGIAEPSTHQTTDWSLERVGLIQQVTTAYLHAVLNRQAEGWSQVRGALAGASHPLGRLESK